MEIEVEMLISLGEMLTKGFDVDAIYKISLPIPY